jgi:hypothetical protein
MDDRLYKEAEGTGYKLVETATSCVLTRFRVRSIWSVLQLYRSYRRVRAEAVGADGLITSLFLMEGPRTCYTLSLWRDERAILEFNSRTHAHIVAANRSFRQVKIDSTGPLIWSAQFRLSAVSPHNLRWEGVDVLLGDRGRPAHAPRSSRPRGTAESRKEVGSNAS